MKDNGWRISAPYLIARQQAYMDRMVEAQKAQPRMPIKHVPQHASTLANLELQKDPDYKRDWTEPLPQHAQIRDEEGNVFVNTREISPEEFAIEDRRRRGSKNTLGQSDESSATDESKERAEHHFMVSPPAKLTEDEKLRLVGLIGIASQPPPQEEWREISWPQAVWHWIRGGKIRNDKNE